MATWCEVTDSLHMARKMFPGQRNSLDALCKRFEIDNSRRQLHGALLDAEILADVYLMLTGGQNSLFADDSAVNIEFEPKVFDVNRPKLSVISATPDEISHHQQRLEAISKSSNGHCLWTQLNNSSD